MTSFRPFQAEFAGNNFEFGENGQKFSKRIENTVGKGEIACKEQFLLFPQCCFKGLLLQTCKNQVLFGKGLMTQRKKPFEYIVGKGENAIEQHNIFYHYLYKFQFLFHFFCPLKMLSTWTIVKFCHLINS